MKKMNCRKNTTPILPLILFLCSAGLSKSYAYDFSAVCSSGQTLYYNITDATNHFVEITWPNSIETPWGSFTKPTGKLTLPTTVTNEGISYSVVSISDYAFYFCNGLTGAMTIPNSIISIGKDCFFGCSGLTSLTISNSVSNIGKGAFSRCINISKITVNSNNTTYDSRNNCNAIIKTSDATLIAGCKTTVIPGTVNTIGHSAFLDCSNLNSITIPNSVINICDSAFCNCTGLTGSLTIPNSVTTIGKRAFYSCYGFTGSLTLSNSIAEIGDETFYGCRRFTGALIIPNSVTTIGTKAFYNCYGFTGSLTLSNFLITIGENAFYGCKGFTGSLVIPNSVTTIGNQAFSSCSGFTGSLTLGNSITTIGNNAFAGCNNFSGSLLIPNSVTSLGEYAFSSCRSLSGTLTISNALTRIEDHTFENCFGINELIWGDLNKIVVIGRQAFANCTSLTSVIIPSSVSSIGPAAFANCSELSTVLVMREQQGVTSMGNSNTFSNCHNNLVIYVPYSKLNAYITELASVYSSRIRPWIQTTIPGYGTSNGKWAFIASPLTSSAAPTAIDDMIAATAIEYDLYRFNQAGTNGEWENYKVHGFDLTNGQGYLYANKSNVNLVFKGDFNGNTTQDVPLSYVSGTRLAGYNLVGNPFPVNAYSSRPYYVMNSDGDAVIPTAISTNEPIAPCTGVIVQAMENENNPTVTFSTTAPSTSNKGNINIALSQQINRGNSTIDRAIVSFNDGDQLGKFVFNEDNAKLYIPQNGKEYAIACTATFGEMPVNFKATHTGEYTLTVNPESVEMEYLHLIDNLTGNDIDLLATPSYTFIAKTDDYASRFRLVFSANNDDLDSDDNFAFISNGQLVVTGEGTLQVIDAIGRQLYAKQVSTLTSNLSPLTSPGVYVLRLVNGENVKTQKIVVK